MNQLINKIIILFLILLTSCGSRKDLVYFQDEPLNKGEFERRSSDVIYQPNDLLTIDVTGMDPETVRPFNLPAVTYAATVLSAQGTLTKQSYLVDAEGNIEFPVLGTIKMGGLTRIEATNKLKTMLSEYVKDPIVNIRISNFTISVLGEVSRPGTFTIQDERVSIPEALGLAGDLTIYGKRNNIFVIREVEGKMKYAFVDLTSINIVNSPVYYLAQNDVLYVEPNGAKIKSSSYNPNTGLVISAVSTLATVIALIIVK